MLSRPRRKILTLRQKAFAKFPDRWKPQVGDCVFVRRSAGDLSWQRSIGMVIAAAMVDEMFVVRLKCANRQSERVWSVEDLRPVE